MSHELHLGDAVEQMRLLPDASVDCVITDPPYPEIDRAYGRMTEAEWWQMMMGVCAETRRILKPSGSAVFILQPNSRKVGSMRGWLWEFMAWVCKDWNMVQDAWWWNTTAMPTVHTKREIGLMRPSLKACVWAGASDCYRNQGVSLWAEAARTQSNNRAKSKRLGGERQVDTSGHSVKIDMIANTSIERGGVTPFNVFPTGTNSGNGNHGHGAGTPMKLVTWWTRYICPPGGTVCDPFTGSGTMGLAALAYGCSFVGIERDEAYHAIATKRIQDAAAQPMLLSVTP